MKEALWDELRTWGIRATEGAGGFWRGTRTGRGGVVIKLVVFYLSLPPCGVCRSRYPWFILNIKRTNFRTKL